ncbi:hypothetical protein GCM10010885_21090 [Alicyclobacillus cellulosilyticus]|uniref:Uncharacterized protein n=1 Tax=Alicyclobacillus cellulosilyticus TaxID=1003997 RepID=A0A917KFF7_9BACL|nr:hypothetical protein [Alicyclobacillus cellulosilyticus]GGJ11546.1 hypothetical protein GCM10010885_21090 [Alicyclobacillus cellulosilyticus]
MKQIPSTLAVAVLLLIAAAWPSVDAWSETSATAHFLVHCLYLCAGGLFGLQTAWWMHRPVTWPAEEARVTS